MTLTRKQNNVFIILLTTELCYSAGHDTTSFYQPDINNVKKIFFKISKFKILKFEKYELPPLKKKNNAISN